MYHKQEPDLLQLYIKHCLIGFAISAVFVGLILFYDVVGLRGLVMGSDIGVLAVFLLWFFHGTVFGSVQFAIVIMFMADDDDDDDHRGRLIPVRIPAHRARGGLTPKR